jgi:hypothetical protein
MDDNKQLGNIRQPDENFTEFTQEDMKHHLLSGDKISVTSRRSQNDFEFNRRQGSYAGLADNGDDQMDSLVDLPTEKHKI